jgi:UDPglucose 6-dehydrogenase
VSAMGAWRGHRAGAGEMTTMYTICMVGTGYVGLVTGACLADFGNRVICVDVDAQRIETLKAGRVPFFEPLLEDLVQRNYQAERLRFSTDTIPAVRDADIIFIAVGTPDRGDGHADLSYLFKVIEDIAPHLSGYKVLVTKSTVPVGTGRRVQQMLRDLVPPGVTVDVASNPEFLREGSAIEDFMRPNRVVIGAETDQARHVMREIYRPLYLLETPIVVTNLETAELIKYASNAFLATKISYVNEMANLCERFGADVRVLAKAMGLDQRIGSKFLHPGIGYGGSCFPKDTEALVKIAESAGVEMRIVKAAIDVNRERPGLAVEKLRRMLGGDLAGKSICLLGLAFKPNTDDVREAPALKMAQVLLQAGARVRAFDPVAMERVRSQQLDITLCNNAYEAMQGCDAVVLVTEWNEFRTLDLERVKSSLRQPVFVDCRNMYDRARMQALGFNYDCYGS